MSHNNEPHFNSHSMEDSIIVDQILTMKRQESSKYLYKYFAKGTHQQLEDCHYPVDLLTWREQICKWTYSVIDHLRLSRSTVALSMDLFDRYLATCGNKCGSEFAVLSSLSTLYIAIKVHEKRKLKLSQLTGLGRGQFSSRDIERMELKVLSSLSWLVHPPLSTDFITSILSLLPDNIHPSVRRKMFECSQYLVEIAVCDPFFIEHRPSTIAFAAILNVLEAQIPFDLFPATSRNKFLDDLHNFLNFHRGRSKVRSARHRLRLIYSPGDKENMDSTQPSADDVDSNSSMEMHAQSSNSRGRISNTSTTARGNGDSRGVLPTRPRLDSFDSKGSNSSARSTISMTRRFLSPHNGSIVRPC